MSCSDEEHNADDAFNGEPSASHSHDFKEKFNFHGRHLTTMSQDSPIRLTKNQLPTWSMHTDSRSFIFLQLQTLSGREDLSTLLLVVCPTGKAVRRRIHIFCTGSQNHLGSAQVTAEEVDLLKRHHREGNYSLVYCSLSITLQDMAGNGVIKREIFDIVRNQSQVSRHSEYQGIPLCISYKSGTSDIQLPIRTTSPKDQRDDQEQEVEQSNEEQKVSKDLSSTQTFAQRWLLLESQNKAEIQSKRMVMERNKSATEVTSQRLSEGSKSRKPSLPTIAGTEDALKAETEKNQKEEEDRLASSLTQHKTTETQKSTAEDRSLKQKRRHHSLPASNQSATRLPSIRNFALRHCKTEELRQKREERKAVEAQRNPNEDGGSKEEQEEQKGKQRKLNQPSLHFSQTRSFLLRRQVTEAAIKRRDEALRKEQERILPSLLESQRRLPSIRKSALRPSKTELKKKRREDRRKQQQALQRQRRAAEARWNCDEEERAKQEQEERKVEHHKPLKQTLHFSPTRSFLLRRQVAEEAAQKQGDGDGCFKEESRHKSLPASPRRLSSVRNCALRKIKSSGKADLEIKREEDKRKQAAEARWNRDEHKLIQSALDCSPTRSSIMRKQTAVEAAPHKKDEEQERLEQTFHELPNPQEDELPETSRNGQKKHVRFSFNQVDEVALKNEKHHAMSRSPSRLSGTFVLPSTVMKYNTPQRGAEDKRRERELQAESAQRKKRFQRSILRDVSQQTREHLSNTPNGQPMHVEPKARETASAETDENGLGTLLPPVKLKESEGHVALPSMIPGIESKVSIIRASSETFCRIAQPVKIPAEFSRKACLYLRGKLQNLSARRAFTKFGNLVSAINNNPTPRTEHLVAFFQFAEIIEFQMYARKERRFSQSSYTQEAEPIRHRVDCYVFKDRRDYIASISLYSVLLLQIRKLFPTVARNLHFIDDVYELTHVPRHVAKCLEVGLKSVNAPSTIYPVLGEILYSMRQPKASLIELNSDPLEN